MRNIVKKTIELDMEAVKKLRKIFDVKTDKEAVNKAMWLITEEDAIIEQHKNLKGKLDLKDIFK